MASRRKIKDKIVVIRFLPFLFVWIFRINVGHKQSLKSQYFSGASFSPWEISLLTSSGQHQASDSSRWVSFLLTALSGACSVWFSLVFLQCWGANPKPWTHWTLAPSQNPSPVSSTFAAQQMPSSHGNLLRSPACKCMGLLLTSSVNTKNNTQKGKP